MRGRDSGMGLLDRLCGPWGALGIFALLSVAGTYPMAFHISAAYLPPYSHEGMDYSHFIWTFWWVKKALVELHTNPYVTDFIFYPIGTTLVFHTTSFYNSLLAVPLQALFGLEVTYNLLFLSSVALSGFCAYLLGLRVTGDRKAAVLSGIIYTYSVNHFTKYGQINLASYQWLPLFCLFYIRSVEGGPWRDRILAALAMALCMMCTQVFPVFLMLFICVSLVYAVFTEGPARVVLYAKATFWIAAFSLMLTAPLLYPVLMELLVYKRFSYLSPSWMTGWQDLLGFSIPEAGHRYFFSWLQVYGYAACLLALFGALGRRDRKVAGFWVAALAFFFVMSLGPYWAFHGKVYEGVRLPFWYLSKVPLINGVRHPYRYWTMVHLALSMLAGIGYLRLRERLSGAGRGAGRAAGLTFLMAALLVVSENTVVPRPYWYKDTPAYYERLRDEPGDFGVVEFPHLGTRQAAYMYYQTVHGKKIEGGYISRIPSYSAELFRDNRLLAALDSVARTGDLDGFEASLRKEDAAALYGKGFRYVVVHKDFLKVEDRNVYRDEPFMDKLLPVSLNGSYRGLFDRRNLEHTEDVFKKEAQVKDFLAIMERFFGRPAYDSGGVAVYRLS